MHVEAEAEPVAGTVRGNARTDVVHGHQIDGARTQDPVAVQRPPLQHHLQETRVVENR